MELTINGVRVIIADAEVSEVIRQYLLADTRFASPRIVPYSLPLIGSTFQDGIYAGIVRGIKGQPDYGLLVGPEAPEKLNWKRAHEFAADHKGWRLLLRPEGWLCKANVPELFKQEWYWTGAQFEADDDLAWAQGFVIGGQDDCLKRDEFRVRLVRSLVLDSTLDQERKMGESMTDAAAQKLGGDK